LVVAYVLNRKFVFSAAAKPSACEFLRFAAVNIVALMQVWLVSVGLAEYMFPYVGFHWHAETVAHTIGVGSPIVTSFFAYKLFVFRMNSVA
jgi:putative flippase GtrA